MADITALGELLIDFTYGGKNEQGQRLFAQNPGGAPANVAVAVARLGGQSAFIGKVGNDMHGKFLAETLKENGVDCEALIADEKYFTTLAFVNIKEDGEREFSFARKHGADKMLSIGDIPVNKIKESKIFHFGSVSLTDEPARSATLFAAEAAKNAGITVAYDPNYRASLWESVENATKNMRSALKFADLVKISDEETELLTGEKNYIKAAEVLVKNGAKIAVVTLGKDGAFVCTKDFSFKADGVKADALDCTGAGDSFWGAFLLRVSQSGKKPENISLDELKEYALFANTAASFCVGHHGAILSLPTAEDIKC